MTPLKKLWFILDHFLGHNPSFVWRRIFSAKVVVRQGAR